MSIVDNAKRPPRSENPFLRGQAASASQARGASNDPLAELARLIGQDDPFDDWGRDSRAAPRREMASPLVASQPAPEWLARPSTAGSGREDELRNVDEQQAPMSPAQNTHETRYGDDP